MPLHTHAEVRAIPFRRITATRLSLKSDAYQGEDLARSCETSGQDLRSSYTLVSHDTRVRYLWI